MEEGHAQPVGGAGAELATRCWSSAKRARMRFRSADYWDLDGDASPPRQPEFAASPRARRRHARSPPAGTSTRTASRRPGPTSCASTRPGPTALAAEPGGVAFTVRSVEEKPWRRSPAAAVHDLDAAAGGRPQAALQSARDDAGGPGPLRAGLHHLHATDSTTLSDQALSAARAQAKALYGEPTTSGPAPPLRKKVKNAQEAHEAIRPAGERSGPRSRPASAVRRHAPALRAGVDAHRGLADGRRGRPERPGPPRRPRRRAPPRRGRGRRVRGQRRVITFPGFLRAYVEGSDDPDAELEDREVRLPGPGRRRRPRARPSTPDGHTTRLRPATPRRRSSRRSRSSASAGPRPTPASSTTILDRGYVWKKGTALVPSWTAFAVDRPARALLRPARRLRLHRLHGGGPRRDRRGARGVGAVARPASTSGLPGAGRRRGRWPPRRGRRDCKAAVVGPPRRIDAREINSIPIGVDADGG